MKLIKGKYVTPSGTEVVVESSSVSKRVLVTVNTIVRISVETQFYQRADLIRRLDILQPVIEKVWGGPMLSVYNSAHRQSVLDFLELVGGYCE